MGVYGWKLANGHRLTITVSGSSILDYVYKKCICQPATACMATGYIIDNALNMDTWLLINDWFRLVGPSLPQCSG